jgi:hypothetical protein
MLDNDVLAKSGVRREQLFPISATQSDRDLFVIVPSVSGSPGIVIWFAGEEVERFPTFDDYFLAMVEYGRQDLTWLKEQAKGERP